MVVKKLFYCLLWAFTQARSLAFSKNSDTHMGNDISHFRAEKDLLKFVCVLFHGKCQ